MAEFRVPDVSSETLGATCVAFDGAAVLIEGRAADRTDLALCLIDHGGALVAAEHCICQRQGETLFATAPAGTTGGRIDLPGVGSIAVPSEERVPVRLCVRLLDPEPQLVTLLPVRRIAGTELPLLGLRVNDAAAPAKARLALQHFAR